MFPHAIVVAEVLHLKIYTLIYGRKIFLELLENKASPAPLALKEARCLL